MDILGRAQGINRDLRKKKTISKTARRLAELDYKDGKVNSYRPFLSLGADIAEIFGYGQQGGSAPQPVKNMVAVNQIQKSRRANVRY